MKVVETNFLNKCSRYPILHITGQQNVRQHNNQHWPLHFFHYKDYKNLFPLPTFRVSYPTIFYLLKNIKMDPLWIESWPCKRKNLITNVTYRPIKLLNHLRLFSTSYQALHSIKWSKIISKIITFSWPLTVTIFRHFFFIWKNPCNNNFKKP